jgi:hypothetical protein
MRDDTDAGSDVTVALTASTAVSLAPEAVCILADLDGATSAQQISRLRAAVREGWIGSLEPGQGSPIMTQFPDGSPRPGETFKDK